MPKFICASVRLKIVEIWSACIVPPFPFIWEFYIDTWLIWRHFFNCIGYTALKVRMTANDEPQCIWKEAVVTHFKVLSHNLYGVTEKTPRQSEPGWIIFRPRFEPEIFRKRIRTASPQEVITGTPIRHHIHHLPSGTSTHFVPTL